MFRIVFILAVLIFPFFIAGCGQKGPLKLPPNLQTTQPQPQSIAVNK